MRPQAAHHAGVLEAAASLDFLQGYASVEPQRNASIAQRVRPQVVQTSRVMHHMRLGRSQKAPLDQTMSQMRPADVVPIPIKVVNN